MSNSRTRLNLIPRRDQTSAVEVWEEAGGSIVTYVDGDPVPTVKRDPVTGVIKNFVGVSVPIVFSFSGYSPSVLAGFAAGSTASQSGNVVTLICGGASPVAHNIPAAKAGYRWWYPGSPGINGGAACWLQNLVIVDANTVSGTLTAPAAVSSESVNGGLAFTAATTICSDTVPASAIGKNGAITSVFRRTCSTDGGTKTAFLSLGGAAIALTVSTTVPYLHAEFGAVNNNSESKQLGEQNLFGVATSSQYVTTVDTSLPQPIAIVAQVAAQGVFILDYADYRIIHRD